MMTAHQRNYLLFAGFVATTFATTTLASALAAPAGGDAPAAAAPGPQAVYDKLCKSCHGADGRGVATKAATLKIDPEKLNLGRAEVKDVARDEARRIVLEGKEKMPAYAKKLKAEDVDPVLDIALKLGEEARKQPQP